MLTYLKFYCSGFHLIASFYPIAFAVSLLALFGWTYFQDREFNDRGLSKVFAGGLIAYLVTVFFADATFGFKLGVLFRDLLVMGAVSFLFKAFFAQARSVCHRHRADWRGDALVF